MFSVSTPSERAVSSPNVSTLSDCALCMRIPRTNTTYIKKTPKAGYPGAVNDPINQAISPAERFGSIIDVMNIMKAVRMAFKITPASNRL